MNEYDLSDAITETVAGALNKIYDLLLLNVSATKTEKYYGNTYVCTTMHLLWTCYFNK